MLKKWRNNVEYMCKNNVETILKQCWNNVERMLKKGVFLFVLFFDVENRPKIRVSSFDFERCAPREILEVVR